MLPVDGAQVLRERRVPHAVVDGELVACLGTDRLERPPEAVEADPLPGHARLLHRLLHGVGDGVMKDDLGLAPLSAWRTSRG